MKKISRDIIDTTDKWFLWYYGVMFLLVFVPAFSNFAMAALFLPFTAFLLCGALWLFGRPGLVMVSAFIILVTVQLLFSSILSFFK